MEKSYLGLDLLPGDEDTEDGKESGEQDEHEADAVQSKTELNPKTLNPQMIFRQ